MQFGKFKRVREANEVNLIPVMNLFVTLIPFLLLAAAFYHVGVIPTSLPSQTDEASDIAADPAAVTVNLLIEPQKIQLSASSAVLDEATLASLTVNLERGPQGHDLEALNKALQAIKLRFDKSDTVIVLPTDDVEYQDLVRVLDSARELKFHQGTAEEASVPLFPVVVLSRKL